jgi:hypothetical protein
MSTIFAGGSRSVTRLGDAALQRITNIITSKHRLSLATPTVPIPPSSAIYSRRATSM